MEMRNFLVFIKFPLRQCADATDCCIAASRVWGILRVYLGCLAAHGDDTGAGAGIPLMRCGAGSVGGSQPANTSRSMGIHAFLSMACPVCRASYRAPWHQQIQCTHAHWIPMPSPAKPATAEQHAGVPTPTTGASAKAKWSSRKPTPPTAKAADAEQRAQPPIPPTDRQAGAEHCAGPTFPSAAR